MPAEWEPHEATWIAWPHNRDGLARQVRAHSLGLRRDRPPAGRGGARPHPRADDARSRSRRAAILEKVGADLDAVEFFACDRSLWTRDYGPLFVKNRAGEVALTDWHFNAWAKYDDWQQRRRRSRATSRKRLEAARHSRPEMVLEGGSIDVNGAGLLLTTEECLLSPVQARNPGSQRDGDRARVCAITSASTQVLWLNSGIAGDDTHGHVDDLARFVGPDTVVVPERRPTSYDAGENAATLRVAPGSRWLRCRCRAPLCVRRPATAGQLRQLLHRQRTGAGADVQRSQRSRGARHPRRAVSRPRSGRHSRRDLVWGLGTLHCMTQQQPASV